MSTIVTRSGKGAPLTSTEVDDNFTNLNTDKYQSGSSPSFADITASGTLSGTAFTNYLASPPAIGGATANAVTGTTVTGATVTATSSFSGPGTGLTGTASGLSIGGNAATVTNGLYSSVSYANPTWLTSISASKLTGTIENTVIGATTPAAATFTTATATTVNGGSVNGTVVTASSSFSGPGTNLTGTASGLSIGGNAATVTNGLYSSVSYSNPTWLTSISASKLTGSIENIAIGNTTPTAATFTSATATDFLAKETVTAGTNYTYKVVLTGSNTTPMISAGVASGASTLGYTTAGTGTHLFYTHNGTTLQFAITSITNAVNYVAVRGSATGNAVRVGATGSDTNVDLELAPKGAGNVVLASGGIRFPDNTVQTTAGGGGGGGSDFSRSFMLTGTTTDATSTELFVNGVSGDRVSATSSTAVYFTAEVVGRRTNGVGVAAMQLKGTAALDSSGNLVSVGSLYEVAVYKSVNTYSADIIMDASQDKITIFATGAAGHTIDWRVSLMLLEV